ncbi:MAG: hypothetical protein R3C28_26610 [Pirellulaceae bacterium]
MSNTRPVHEIRCGSMKAAIWLNESNGNGSQYNVTLNRLYRLPPDERTKNDNGWRQTSSLRRDDLLIAGEVLRQAFGWICQQAQPSADSSETHTTVASGEPRF